MDFSYFWCVYWQDRHTFCQKNWCSTCCCPQGGAVQPPLAVECWERTTAASSPFPAFCQIWPCRSRTWCLLLPAGSSSSLPGGTPTACGDTEGLRRSLCRYKFLNHGTSAMVPSLPVVLFQRLHQVPAALDVPPLDVGVQAWAQRELKRLAGDGLRRAVYAEIAAGEALVEVALLQVQPDGEHKPKQLKSLNSLHSATQLWGNKMIISLKIKLCLDRRIWGIIIVQP